MAKAKFREPPLIDRVLQNPYRYAFYAMTFYAIVLMGYIVYLHHKLYSHLLGLG